MESDVRDSLVRYLTAARLLVYVLDFSEVGFPVVLPYLQIVSNSLSVCPEEYKSARVP